MHLDQEQTQRLVHGELSPSTERAAREHLALCNECRAHVAETERQEDEVQALLRSVDHPAPRIDVRAIVARARARHFGWMRWAAGILLALGLAGAAYAAPGSPLRTWAKAVAAWLGGGPKQAPEASVAGIAVAPRRELVIQFTAHQTVGAAQVSLTDGAEVVVRAPLGAAMFTADADRLVIDNTGSQASFEIEIPRTAPRVEIRVGQDRTFLKEGTRVTGSLAFPLTP